MEGGGGKMMEEEIIVEINMPLEERQKLQEQYNKVLDQFKSFLQTEFGTSNINRAVQIAGAIIMAQIAFNIITLGVGLPKIASIDLSEEFKFQKLEEWATVLDQLKKIEPEPAVVARIMEQLGRKPEATTFEGFVDVLLKQKLGVAR